MSYQGISQGARDSARLYEAQSLMKGLQTTFASKNRYPVPDSPIVNLLYAGTQIGYQGYAGQNVLPQDRVTGNMMDPLYGTYFVYNTNTSQTGAEIMGYLEGPNNLAYHLKSIADTANAASAPNYAGLYPFVKGDTLGIIVANNTGSTDNTPLQTILGNNASIDLSNSGTTAPYQAYIYSNTGIISGSGFTTTGSGTLPSLYMPTLPINGTCGSASGQALSSAPTNPNLCLYGTLSGSVAGGSSGPWSWTCAGSNGGTSSPNCTASVATVSGSCNSLLANASFYG